MPAVTPADRFAEALLTAMARAGVNRAEAALRAGLSRETVGIVLNDRRLPRLRTAEALAEALDAPALAAIVREARARTCDLCDQPFIDGMQGRPQRYCGDRCRSAAHARRGRDGQRRRTLTETRLTRKRLDDALAAVGEFCRRCTLGEDWCRSPDCELRPVSPIPLYRAGRRVA